MSPNTPSNNSEINDYLTKQIRKDLQIVREDQRFEPIVFVDNNIRHPTQNRVVIIQLDKSYDGASWGYLVYENDWHILGKALRLLVYLQDQCDIYNYFKHNNIVRIIVTSAHTIQFINDSNKWVFDTDTSKGTVSELIGLRSFHADLFETAIQSLVSENRID